MYLLKPSRFLYAFQKLGLILPKLLACLPNSFEGTSYLFRLSKFIYHNFRSLVEVLILEALLTGSLLIMIKDVVFLAWLCILVEQTEEILIPRLSITLRVRILC